MKFLPLARAVGGGFLVILLYPLVLLVLIMTKSSGPRLHSDPPSRRPPGGGDLSFEGWEEEKIYIKEGSGPLSLEDLHAGRWARRVIEVLVLLLVISVVSPFGLVAPPDAVAAEPLDHLHLAFDPTELSPDDCSEGPVEATDTTDTVNTFVACSHDQAGTPLSGTIVTATLASGVGSVTPTTATSDGSGRATFTVGSTQTGQSVISATAQLDTVTVFADNTITKNWTGLPAATITLAPPAGSNPVGSTHRMTATVTDTANNPAANGAVVTFTVIGAGAQENVATTTNGEAIFDFVSTQSGQSTITASARGQTQTVVSNIANKTWIAGAITTFTVDPVRDTNTVGETHTFFATFRDTHGNPTGSALPVAWERVSGPGNFIASQATTDGQGRATATYVSQQPGESIVKACRDQLPVPSSTCTDPFDTPFNRASKTWILPQVLEKRFTSLTPARILDTRDGTGQPAPGAIPPGGEINVSVTGEGGVPGSGVDAVVVNVTVDQPGASGFLTVYPAGQTRPLVSNLNFLPGETRPNLASVKLGDAGALTVYNGSSGNIHVLFDVAGWYSDASQPAEGGSFLALTPSRLLDTRDGTGQLTQGAIPANGSLTLTVQGFGGVPGSGVAAAVLNVTVDQPQATGYLTVYPEDEPRPLASNLNFTPGTTIPNLTAVKLSEAGEVVIFNGSPGEVHVIADAYGAYSDPSATFGGGAHEAVSPSRILDTRDGTGGHSVAVPAGGEIAVTVTGAGGIPSASVQAVVINVTVDQPEAAGYLTVYPAGEPRPLASNLNFTPGRPVPNLVKVKVGDGGAVRVFNGSSGTVHVIFDAAGWFALTG